MDKGNSNAKNVIFNSRGSAIIMALVIMSLLILLGLAVSTLSIGTMVSNAADATTNDAYYAAEAGINSAIEQLKYETSRYYSDMLDAEGSEYNALYGNFFSAVNDNAQMYFVEPVVAGVSTVTTFSTGEFDADTNMCEYLIQCNATTEDGTRYRVNGSLYIKKVNVRTGGETWLTIDGAAIKSGDTFTLGKNNGTTVNNGDVIVADISLKEAWQCKVNNGNLVIDADVGDSIHDTLDYPSYTDPILDDIDAYVTKNNYTFNWGNIPEAPICITTADGIDIHFASCTVPEGVIHGKGDIHINNGNYTADVYCDGDIHINNCTLNGDVYVRGDAEINNAIINGNVYCDGYVDIRNQSVNGCVYSDDGIKINNATLRGALFSTEKVTISQTGVTGGIIYSKTKVEIGNLSAEAAVFSGGDIEITQSMSLTGCAIAKGEIYYKGGNKWITVNYSQPSLEAIMADEDYEFFFETSAASQLNENVFYEESITAEGRIN